MIELGWCRLAPVFLLALLDIVNAALYSASASTIDLNRDEHDGFLYNLAPVIQRLPKKFPINGREIVSAVPYKFHIGGLLLASAFALNYTPSLHGRYHCHERGSRRLHRLFANQGGLYIKMAQMMASTEGMIPVSYSQKMKKFRDQGPITSISALNHIFIEELGHDIAEVFSEFDPIPIGSASIGQVHRARLRETGELVAVKVQHASINENSNVDLRALESTLSVVKFFFPDLNVGWIVEELRQSLKSELNFKIEAQNSEKTRKFFNLHPKYRHTVKIPAIKHQLSTKRILVMEYCPGAKLDDPEALEAAGIDQASVYRLLVEIFSEMVFVNNFLHCDPHPGNLLVQKNGNGQIVVVILDHGLSKAINPAVALSFAQLFMAFVQKDKKLISELMVQYGISPKAIEVLSEITKIVKSNFQNNNNMEQLKADITNFLLDNHGNEEVMMMLGSTLQKLPREFFYILKAYSLLFPLENSFKLSKKASSRLLLRTFHHYCLIALKNEDAKNQSSGYYAEASRLVSLIKSYLSLFLP